MGNYCFLSSLGGRRGGSVGGGDDGSVGGGGDDGSVGGGGDDGSVGGGGDGNMGSVGGGDVGAVVKQVNSLKWYGNEFFPLVKTLLVTLHWLSLKVGPDKALNMIHALALKTDQDDAIYMIRENLKGLSAEKREMKFLIFWDIFMRAGSLEEYLLSIKKCAVQGKGQSSPQRRSHRKPDVLRLCSAIRQLEIPEDLAVCTDLSHDKVKDVSSLGMVTFDFNGAPLRIVLSSLSGRSSEAAAVLEAVLNTRKHYPRKRFVIYTDAETTVIFHVRRRMWCIVMDKPYPRDNYGKIGEVLILAKSTVAKVESITGKGNRYAVSGADFLAYFGAKYGLPNEELIYPFRSLLRSSSFLIEVDEELVYPFHPPRRMMSLSDVDEE